MAVESQKPTLRRLQLLISGNHLYSPGQTIGEQALWYGLRSPRRGCRRAMIGWSRGPGRPNEGADNHNFLHDSES